MTDMIINQDSPQDQQQPLNVEFQKLSMPDQSQVGQNESNLNDMLHSKVPQKTPRARMIFMYVGVILGLFIVAILCSSQVDSSSIKIQNRKQILNEEYENIMKIEAHKNEDEERIIETINEEDQPQIFEQEIQNILENINAQDYLKQMQGEELEQLKNEIMGMLGIDSTGDVKKETDEKYKDQEQQLKMLMEQLDEMKRQKQEQENQIQKLKNQQKKESHKEKKSHKKNPFKVNVEEEIKKEAKRVEKNVKKNIKKAFKKFH